MVEALSNLIAAARAGLHEQIDVEERCGNPEINPTCRLLRQAIAAAETELAWEQAYTLAEPEEE